MLLSNLLRRAIDFWRAFICSLVLPAIFFWWWWTRYLRFISAKSFLVTEGSLHLNLLLSFYFLLIHKLFKALRFFHFLQIWRLIINDIRLAHMMVGSNRKWRFLCGGRNGICNDLVMLKKTLNRSSIEHLFSFFFFQLLHFCVSVCFNLGFHARWYILFFIDLLNCWVFHRICLYFYVLIHFKLLISRLWNLLIWSQSFLINVFKGNYQILRYFVP